MTPEQIRAGLVQQMETGWNKAAIPVVYENTQTVDLDAAPDLFVHFSVRFVGNKQANISTAPFARQYGRLRVMIFLRENLGTVKALQALQAVVDLFQFKTLGGTHLEAAQPGGEATRQGWYTLPVEVPFFADSNS